MDSLGHFFGGKNMCGVTGAFGNNISKMEDQFRKATLRLSHRGPDFQKYNLINESLLLGHTRLSILDLDARANQPMSDKKGNTLVFNGEIYNFKELRNELGGYKFKTSSDHRKKTKYCFSMTNGSNQITSRFQMKTEDLCLGTLTSRI